MAFDSIYRIAGSSMNAQTVRLNTVASNLANADSAAAKAEESGKASEAIGIKIEVLPDKTAAAETGKPFVPPDGWRPRKRGQFTVYCRKDYNVKGTRFPAETCYDEAGIRAMVRQTELDQENIDQMRRICANDSACGTH